MLNPAVQNTIWDVPAHDGLRLGSHHRHMGLRMRFVVLGHMDPNDEAYWSGIPMHLVQALRAAGHEVTTIGPLDPAVTPWARIKGRFYRHAFGRNYLVNRDPAIFKLRAVHANHLLEAHADADAVITLYPPDSAFLQSPAPLIVIHDATWPQLLDFYPGYERSNLAQETIEGGLELDRRAFANCDLSIFSSRWAADSAIADYGTDPSKVRVVPFGAGLATEPSRTDIKRWLEHRQEDPCRLLFVGVDWFRKGGDIALAAAQKLHHEGMPVELMVAGCTPPGAMPSFVRCFGFLSKKVPAEAARIHRLFQQASFLVLPTRADCFGVVFCEAAAYGLPVVTTNVGGIPEILRSREWGVMFPPSSDPEDLARFIRTSRAQPEIYARMAWAARRDFENRLSWRAFCDELVAIVQSAKPENGRTRAKEMTARTGASA